MGCCPVERTRGLFTGSPISENGVYLSLKIHTTLWQQSAKLRGTRLPLVRGKNYD